MQDTGSYSPEKIEAIWADAELAGPDGAVPLAALKPLDRRPAFRGDGVPREDAVRVVYDIAGKGFTRFRGSVGIENQEITSDLNPQIRFFISIASRTWTA